MIPVPEIRLSVDCVPWAAPLTSIFNPKIPPLPVQSVLLLVGSSVPDRLKAPVLGMAIAGVVVYVITRRV